MSIRIEGVPAVEPKTIGERPPEKGDPASGFAELLVDTMHEAQASERAAESAAQDFAAGKTGIHEAILAQERAGIAVKFAVTVKNRALEAYRDLMNTQL